MNYRYGLFEIATGALVRETSTDEDFEAYPDGLEELRICPDHPTVSAVDCLDCDRLNADAPKGSATAAN